MKIILQILLLFSFQKIYSQNISDAMNDYLKKELHRDYRKEFQLEFNDVIQKADNHFSIDLEIVDTLYFVRGLDIQNRNAFGRLWNNDFKLHYFDFKKWNEGKLLIPNVVISTQDKDNATKNFDVIINHIENEDFDILDDYAGKHRVLSGISWLVFIIYRTDKRVIIKSYSMDDFDNISINNKN